MPPTRRRRTRPRGLAEQVVRDAGEPLDEVGRLQVREVGCLRAAGPLRDQLAADEVVDAGVACAVVGVGERDVAEVRTCELRDNAEQQQARQPWFVRMYSHATLSEGHRGRDPGCRHEPHSIASLPSSLVPMIAAAKSTPRQRTPVARKGRRRRIAGEVAGSGPRCPGWLPSAPEASSLCALAARSRTRVCHGRTPVCPPGRAGDAGIHLRGPSHRARHWRDGWRHRVAFRSAVTLDDCDTERCDAGDVEAVRGELSVA